MFFISLCDLRYFDLATTLWEPRTAFCTFDAIALFAFMVFLLCSDRSTKWMDWLAWLLLLRSHPNVPVPGVPGVPASRTPKSECTIRRPKGVKDIPMPGPSLPILGTRWIYSVGWYQMDKIHEAYRDMFKRLGNIIREEALWRYPVVSVLARKDIEAVLRRSSRYPVRPPTEVTAYYRKSRPDRYTNLGLVNEQGETWHHLRSLLTPELTSAKTMQRFLPELNTVAVDFASLLATSRDENGHIRNFEEFANRFGLESTCTLILGRRMGFLDLEVDHLAVKLAAAVRVHFCASRDTFYGLPFWKVFPTKAYKKLVESEEVIYDIISSLVDAALLEERNTAQVEAVQSVFLSVLEAPGLDIRDKKAAIIDFIAAGIQTLGNTLVFLLYLIAKHPEAQQKLYEEVSTVTSPGSPITSHELKSMPYLRACIMEAFRVLPTAPCVARVLESPLELSGYNLNAGTVVLCHTWLAGLEDSNFPNGKEYKPERWFSNGTSTNSAATFLVTPFGVGRRMCPGKRFVEQALHVILAETVRQFEIGFEGELGLQFEFLLAPKAPADFTFRNRTY